MYFQVTHSQMWRILTATIIKCSQQLQFISYMWSKQWRNIMVMDSTANVFWDLSEEEHIQGLDTVTWTVIQPVKYNRPEGTLTVWFGVKRQRVIFFFLFAQGSVVWPFFFWRGAFHSKSQITSTYILLLLATMPHLCNIYCLKKWNNTDG